MHKVVSSCISISYAKLKFSFRSWEPKEFHAPPILPSNELEQWGSLTNHGIKRISLKNDLMKTSLVEKMQASLIEESSATRALVQKYSLACAWRIEPFMFLARNPELEVSSVNLQSDLTLIRSKRGLIHLHEF